MLVFSHTFSVIWKFIFPCFGYCMYFCFTQNIFFPQNIIPVFKRFACNMRNNSSHVFGVVWVVESRATWCYLNPSAKSRRFYVEKISYIFAPKKISYILKQKYNLVYLPSSKKPFNVCLKKPNFLNRNSFSYWHTHTHTHTHTHKFFFFLWSFYALCKTPLGETECLRNHYFFAGSSSIHFFKYILVTCRTSRHTTVHHSHLSKLMWLTGHNATPLVPTLVSHPTLT